MNLNGKIEVEPLADARVSKIKRSLFEALDHQEFSEPMLTLPEARGRARRLWTVRVVVAMGAVAALVLVVAWRNPPAQHPGFADNSSRIVTGTTASHLALGDSSMDVKPDSVLLVNGDDDRGVLLVLERGGVTCDVNPRRGRPPLVVQAGGVRVRVVGTHFTVTRIEESARVEVEHGTVEITAAGQTSLLRDGETWGTPESVRSTPPSAAPGPPRAPDQQAPMTVDIPIAKRSASPMHLAPQQPAQPPPALEAASPSERAAQDTIGQNDRINQELFEQASELEKHDPSQAIATYRKIAEGSGRWAMNALFAQGRLESDRGSAHEGRALLSSYLARYPRGPNAADARLLLDRMK